MHHYKDSSIPQPIMVARAALISCLFAVCPVAIFQKTLTMRHLHKRKIPMRQIEGGGRLLKGGVFSGTYGIMNAN